MPTSLDGPAFAERFADACTRARSTPVRVFRLWHPILHCQMGLYLSLAEAVSGFWELAGKGICTQITLDWLDLRP